MGTTVIKEGSATRIVVQGRLDTSTVKEFETAIQPLLTQTNPDITIDTEKLSYINSSGLRLFILLLKAVKANNGALVIVNMNPNIRGIFDMTGFSNLFIIR